MVSEFIMLPVRVGVRATRLWFRAVEETVSITTSAAGRLIDALGPGGSDSAPVQAPPSSQPVPARPSQPVPSPPSQPVPARPSQPVPARPAPARESPSAPAPVHVSEEPVLVEEFAEPGAEDGAGAEVHVNPPWDGYERMTVKQVVARLAGADAAELAAVELFEATSRRRQTILDAVERELRRVNGSGSRRNQTQRG